MPSNRSVDKHNAVWTYNEMLSSLRKERNMLEYVTMWEDLQIVLKLARY